MASSAALASTSGLARIAPTRAGPTPVLTGARAALRGRAVLPRRAGCAAVRQAQQPAARPLVTRAAAGGTYELSLPKPIGVKFARGKDGGAYVARVPKDPRYEMFKEGDKIVAISASFGEDVWVAENYGSVMYAIRTRSGEVFFRMQDNGGDTSGLSGSSDDAFMKERRGGNYGVGTAEVQRRNYVQAKEVERERTEMFNDALDMFKAAKYEDAIRLFEDVSGLEPRNYRGDNFATSTDLYKLSQYNVACAYCKLNQVDAAMTALEECMRQGYDDFDKIRSDPNLAPVRASDKFKPLMNKFDESFINENALKNLQGLFSFGKKN